MQYIRYNAYYARQKVRPKRPQNIEEACEKLSAYEAKTSTNENFLYHLDRDRKIVVFTCNTNLQILRNSEVIYMDGTFQYCAKHFLQLFTLHGLLNDHYIPLVFVLLPDKTEDSYKACLHILASTCDFYPRRVVIDFEQSIHNAVAEVWGAEVIGCKFHLLQAWYRQVQRLGLSTDYKTNTEVGKWISYTFGLPFLAPDEVTQCYLQDLLPIMPDNSKLTTYSNYLLNNYIADSARFPSHLWACRTADMKRTTNACESFHAAFNSSFYQSHPDVFTFIDALLLFQNKTYTKINSISQTCTARKEVRARQLFLQRKIEDYESGTLTRFEYVKCLSYFYKGVLGGNN